MVETYNAHEENSKEVDREARFESKKSNSNQYWARISEVFVPGSPDGNHGSRNLNEANTFSQSTFQRWESNNKNNRSTS